MLLSLVRPTLKEAIKSSFSSDIIDNTPLIIDTLAFEVSSPVPEADAQFGYAVDLSGDLGIVGAHLNNTGFADSGAAYIYNVTRNELLYTLANPTPEANDLFGQSVAIDGNRAIVGARNNVVSAVTGGSAHIFDTDTGGFLRTLDNPTPQVGDRFGESVSISGNIAIVGAPEDNTAQTSAGSAYIYQVDTGALLWTINNPNPSPIDYFGFSVAIDGDRAIIGAYGEDTGASDAGSAYIYDATTGGLLHTLNNPQPSDARFGDSVDISGNLAVVGAFLSDVGASGAGSVYVFNVTSGEIKHIINNPNPITDDQFGNSVSIDGNKILIGAFRTDVGGQPDAGVVHVYNANSGKLINTIENPTPVSNDRFGGAVALSSDIALLGAYQEDTGGNNAGSAYVYGPAKPVKLNMQIQELPDGTYNTVVIDTVEETIIFNGDVLWINGVAQIKFEFERVFAIPVEYYINNDFHGAVYTATTI